MMRSLIRSILVIPIVLLSGAGCTQSSTAPTDSDGSAASPPDGSRPSRDGSVTPSPDLRGVPSPDLAGVPSPDLASPAGGTVGGVPGGVAGPGTTVAGCAIFPGDNPWNVRIDGANVVVIHDYDQGLPLATHLHPDFGDWTTDHYGIPWSTTPAGTTPLPITFNQWPDQSDPGPNGWIDHNAGTTAYPFPQGIKVEGDPGLNAGAGGDQHALVLEQATGGGACTLWEAFACWPVPGPGWICGNGASFDLGSNALRPDGWTSGDAAGLSVFAGLVRLEEVQAGSITHALRVTFNFIQETYIHPATHAVSGHTNGPNDPPMGLRLRLKASFNTAPYSGPTLVILTAMKQYGLIVADIGTDWYFQGDSDDGWIPLIDQLVADFKNVHGSDFEAVSSGTPSNAGL
jgi:hypothetical protein